MKLYIRTWYRIVVMLVVSISGVSALHAKPKEVFRLKNTFKDSIYFLIQPYDARYLEARPFVYELKKNESVSLSERQLDISKPVFLFVVRPGARLLHDMVTTEGTLYTFAPDKIINVKIDSSGRLVSNSSWLASAEIKQKEIMSMEKRYGFYIAVDGMQDRAAKDFGKEKYIDANL